MKRNLILTIIFLLAVSLGWSQTITNSCIPLLGDDAPSFTAKSTNGTINFPKDFGDNWKVLFSHPADFTPVCSSELLELAALQDNFNNLDVKIIVISTDKLETHNQWIKSIDSVSYKNRQPQKVNFPLVADEDHWIARKYGMIHANTNTTRYVRGVFIIDPLNKVRAMFFYPMNVGRNIDEITRTIVALQTSDKNHVLTPADWHPGDDVLVPYTNYTGDQKDLAKKENPNLYSLTWYMWFKKTQ
ncbi:MAG: peroxiredoxin [Bacteroidetes bacterium]|nr:peroxiredoxin [Bacteroidota bacterium]